MLSKWYEMLIDIIKDIEKILYMEDIRNNTTINFFEK